MPADTFTALNSPAAGLIDALIEADIPFALSSRRSAKFGELDPELAAKACAGLERYHRLRAVIAMELPRTLTQKIDRPRACPAQLLSLRIFARSAAAALGCCFGSCRSLRHRISH